MDKFSYIFVFILVLACPAHSKTIHVDDKDSYNILIIHSYTENLTAYSQFSQLVKKHLVQKDIQCSTRTFYLDCERYLKADEEARMYNYLESLQNWKPDIILVNDDQATYTLMACNHPLGKSTPVIFSAVNFPNWPLLKAHRNVTGYWDRPEYLANIQLIEKLYGKSNILFFNDIWHIGRLAFNAILKEVATSDITLYDGLYNPEKKLPEALSLGTFDKSSLFTIKPYKLSSKGLLEIFEKNSYTACLQIILDFNVLTIGRLANVPNFTVINNGFNDGKGITGGYFTTLQLQAEGVADMTARVLTGTPVSNIPIIQSPKVYAFDWNEMQRFHIDMKKLPEGSIIYNLPLEVRFHTYIVITAIIILLILFYIIFHLIYMYRREYKRKKMAQVNLIKEQKFLKLALEGGNTYAWRMVNNEFIFEDDFYTVNSRLPQAISLTELLLMAHPDDQVNLENHIHEVYSGIRSRATVQCRFNFNGKSYIWWELRYNHSDTTSGDEHNIIGLCLNIQSFKDKEQKLTILQERAEEASKMKSAFLANMSHEIRTPLNAIVGFSNILQEEENLTDDEKLLFKETINKNSSLLLKLINDILELSRIESGRMSFSFEDCHLNELVEEVYLTHYLLISSNISFIKEIPELPVLIHVDRHRFTQVITNFINNAVKFTTEGHILLGYTYDPLKKSVSIFVEDTGKGMSKEAKEKVFERFYKNDEFAQGTGLGLSICQTIVERLGGTILLTSEEGKGSRFTVILPCTLYK